MSFDFLNKRVNPFVRALLCSPAHALLSKKLALLTVTGRRTGRKHTFPVGYAETPAGVTIRIAMSEAKVWWRNLRTPAPVEILIRGKRRSGTGVAIESDGEVRVEVQLDE